MSTILNALKQVEEQIRNEAERRAADGAAAAADPSKTRVDLPAPPKAGASADTEEMMKFYSGLIDALTRIQTRMQDEMEQGLAEARGARDELAAAVAALQAQLPRQAEALRQELVQRDADRDAANARLAALHAQTEALKKLFADATETSAQLSQAVAAVQNDLIRQGQSVQREFQRRDAEREAAVADAARALLAQSAETGAKLALSVAALRDDLTRNMAAVQEEFARRAAAQGAVQSDLVQARALLAAVQAELGELRSQCGAAHDLAAEAGADQAGMARTMEELKAAMVRMTEEFRQALERREAESAAEPRVSEAPPQPGTDAAEMELLSGRLEDTRAANADLARAVAALQADFARQSDAVRMEFQRRDAELDAANAALAEAQSQIAALKRALAERPAAEPPHAARSAACADTAKQATRIGKTDALQLHAAARKAYAKGNHAEALELLDVIDTAFPGNASVLCNRAQCLAGLGRRAEARKLCERLVNEMNHEPARELLVQLGG